MKFVRHVMFTVIASAVAIGFVGCGGDQRPEPKTPETTGAATTAMVTDMGPPAPTNATTTPGPASPMGSTSARDSGASSTAAESPPSDENIAAITNAVNTSEMEKGRLASTKGKDPKVKKFGAMVVADHTDIAKKHAKMTPQENAMSTMIMDESTKVIEQLKTATGSDFDRMYIDAQVKNDQMLLEALDQKLIPNAKSADLKTELMALRPKVDAHLKQAQEIQKGLGMAGSSGAPGIGPGTNMSKK
jgi:putative membrane protein